MLQYPGKDCRQFLKAAFAPNGQESRIRFENIKEE
jgi:hypothetical protein